MKSVSQQEDASVKPTLLILGGDGYLGWSLGLAFANRTDYNVVLIDSMIKRQWEKEVSAKHVVPFKGPEDRINEFKRLYGKDNMSFEKVCLLDGEAVADMIKRYKPAVILNAAQQPSAPFSMMNAKNATATFANNINGNINVLWAIAEIDKNIKYIKLGSAGCFMGIDSDFVPLTKVDLRFTADGKERSVQNSWLPMDATDFYHQSKVSDFLTNELACSVWGLKVLTVQQSTIFGATIEENRASEHHSLSARFNYDAVFSTVINRFACQIAIGHPITVYGDGKQTTGVISLTDTVDNFIKFAELDLQPGEHRMIHNYTNRLSINEIAEAITQASNEGVITHIENPRTEGGGMRKREVELDPSIKGAAENHEEKLMTELKHFVAFTKMYKDNIDPAIIMPTVTWNKEPAAKVEAAQQPAYHPEPEFDLGMDVAFQG